MPGNLDFESLVSQYYAPLYRFALSITRKESDACDLTQQTFYVWATKGHQLQDASKVKTWLFTTLHRQFLAMQRRQERFPHFELDEVTGQLPSVDPALVDQLDAAAVLDWLAQVDPTFQASLALFYLEDYTQKEIAEILNIPLGTVKSRIARGMAQLQMILTRRAQPQADARKDRRD
jgi:RNA polymerase sigma-70 factor (ECF subfamily)